MKYAVLSALVVASLTYTPVQAQSELIYLGYYMSEALQGIAQATQDDYTDFSTDCSIEAADAGAVLVTMMDQTTYTSGTFNSGDFSNYVNIFLMKLMAAMDSCQYTSFMVYVNNRLNDYSFLAGLATNMVVQLSLYSQDPQPAIYTSSMTIYTDI